MGGKPMFDPPRSDLGMRYSHSADIPALPIVVPCRLAAHTPFVSRDGSRQMCHGRAIACDRACRLNDPIPLTSRMILSDKSATSAVPAFRKGQFMDETTPQHRLAGTEHWTDKGAVKLFLWNKCAGDPAKAKATILFVHGSSMAS